MQFANENFAENTDCFTVKTSKLKALKCKPSAHSIEMWNPYTSVAPPQLMVLTMHQKEQHVMHHFHEKNGQPHFCLRVKI